MNWLRLICLLCVVFAAPTLGAQSLRDPTQAPGLGSAGRAGDGAAPARSSQGRWSVIVVDGRPHVAVGTRLYAEGQMLGPSRIERITETEVWLREGRELRKVPLYAGVQRRSVPSAQP